MTPAVSVILVNYRQASLAARCVASLREAFVRDAIAGEIVLVDCASGDAEGPALAKIPADARVDLPENRGYAGGVNAGLRLARSARLLISNVDVEYRAGSLSPLLACLEDPSVGAAAPVCVWDAGDRVFLPPGFAPGFLEEIGLLGAARGTPRDDRRFAAFARGAVRLWTRGGSANHLSGAVLATRRDVFDRVGRFDERFAFEYEETEWERRVRAAKLDLRVVPSSRVRHLWGGSSSRDPETQQRRRLSRRRDRQLRFGRIGRAILERSEARPRPVPPFPVRSTVEIAARPGAWLALSPHASRIPFAGADLSRPFRLPPELESAGPAGDWFWTVFSAETGLPIETFVRRPVPENEARFPSPPSAGERR